MFIAFWARGLRHIRRVLESKESNGNHTKQREDFEGILFIYENLAFRLCNAVVDAASEGILEKEVLYSIGERWTLLDEVLDWYHGYTDSSRTIPTWLVENPRPNRLKSL